MGSSSFDGRELCLGFNCMGWVVSLVVNRFSQGKRYEGDLFSLRSDDLSSLGRELFQFQSIDLLGLSSGLKGYPYLLRFVLSHENCLGEVFVEPAVSGGFIVGMRLVDFFLISTNDVVAIVGYWDVLILTPHLGVEGDISLMERIVDMPHLDAFQVFEVMPLSSLGSGMALCSPSFVRDSTGLGVGDVTLFSRREVSNSDFGMFEQRYSRVVRDARGAGNDVDASIAWVLMHTVMRQDRFQTVVGYRMEQSIDPEDSDCEVYCVLCGLHKDFAVKVTTGVDTNEGQVWMLIIVAKGMLLMHSQMLSGHFMLDETEFELYSLDYICNGAGIDLQEIGRNRCHCLKQCKDEWLDILLSSILGSRCSACCVPNGHYMVNALHKTDLKNFGEKGVDGAKLSSASGRDIHVVFTHDLFLWVFKDLRTNSTVMVWFTRMWLKEDIQVVQAEELMVNIWCWCTGVGISVDDDIDVEQSRCVNSGDSNVEQRRGVPVIGWESDFITNSNVEIMSTVGFIGVWIRDWRQGMKGSFLMIPEMAVCGLGLLVQSYVDSCIATGVDLHCHSSSARNMEAGGLQVKTVVVRSVWKGEIAFVEPNTGSGPWRHHVVNCQERQPLILEPLLMSAATFLVTGACYGLGAGVSPCQANMNLYGLALMVGVYCVFCSWHSC